MAHVNLKRSVHGGLSLSRFLNDVHSGPYISIEAATLPQASAFRAQTLLVADCLATLTSSMFAMPTRCHVDAALAFWQFS